HFLLGSLRRLLPRRPGGNHVIASPTIDHRLFAEHGSAVVGAPVRARIRGRTAAPTSRSVGSDANRGRKAAPTNGGAVPVIEVSGRTYPVTVHYRPADKEQDLTRQPQDAPREIEA